jgi:regulatory protein
VSGGGLVIESAETGRTAGGRILKLRFQNGGVLEIGASYLPSELPEAFFCPGVPVRDGDEGVLRLAAECLRAEKAALRLIARAEQCAAILARKLERRGYRAEAVSGALARLETLDLIRDSRYAELWLKARVHRGTQGPRMLLGLLRARGIGRECAETALKAVLTPEAEDTLLLRRLAGAGKKPGKAGPGGVPGIRYFLRAEGFSSAAITRYFEEQEHP